MSAPAAYAQAIEMTARSFEKPVVLPLKDPVEFAQRKLGVHLWSKQRDIATSVKNHRRTAVRSCHGIGKSFIASAIAAWWVDSHPPGEAIVVSTAPSWKQVHAILWAEIKRRHTAGKLAGRVLQSDEWKLDDGTLVAFGRKPADTDEDGFQGIHRRYVLVILDEACGIPESLWTGAAAITTNDDARILAIGNPTDPASRFAKVCAPGSPWNVIGVSALESPNFTGEAIPESMRPLLISPEWAEEMKVDWGEESPAYVARVLGEFPEIGEDVLIPPKWIEAAQQRELGTEGPNRLAVDVARFGSDETIIVHAQGGHSRVIGHYSKQATTETTGRVIAAARELPALTEIRVDGVGVGGGVVDELAENVEVAERGFGLVDMQAGAAAIDNRKFLNARAEWWWGLRQMFQDGDMDIDPDDDRLAAQLGSIRYKFTSRGQLQIESKEDMKKRGLPSPDRADALMMVHAHLPDDSGDVVTAGDVYGEVEDHAGYMPRL
jgi:hypothetical protein